MKFFLFFTNTMIIKYQLDFELNKGKNSGENTEWVKIWFFILQVITILNLIIKF